MISGGPKDTITSLWTKGLKALVPPNSFGPPTMVGVVVDFKDRAPDIKFYIQVGQGGRYYYRPLVDNHFLLKKSIICEKVDNLAGSTTQLLKGDKSTDNYSISQEFTHNKVSLS